jgi:anti-anti-sigma factor
MSDGMAIRVKGEPREEFAGALLDGLLAPTECRPALVSLDLSELRFMSSLALGVLAGFRRGVVRAGGRVRLVGEVQPAVGEALSRAGLLGLFVTDAETTPR